MDRIKSVSKILIILSVMFIIIGAVLQVTDILSIKNIKDFKLDSLATSSSVAVKSSSLTDSVIINNNAAVGIMRKEVYKGMTLDEVANQINKSLKNDISGKGMVIASKSIELGVDPFVATAIILHETGCGQNSCSKIARECYNFGGQKGAGCGAYRRYSSIDEGLQGMIINLHNNFYSKGLTTVESIGPRYAESGTWVSKINWYVNKIKNA